MKMNDSPFQGGRRESMGQIRRSKSQVLQDNIDKLNEKIQAYEQNIVDTKAQIETLKSELTTILEKEAREKEEADMKELAKLMKKKKITLDDIKEMIEKTDTE